jgi:hypothetical protein
MPQGARLHQALEAIVTGAWQPTLRVLGLYRDLVGKGSCLLRSDQLNELSPELREMVRRCGRRIGDGKHTYFMFEHDSNLTLGLYDYLKRLEREHSLSA